jgi:putative inorganic carbon (HCO3(-)) transporter
MLLTGEPLSLEARGDSLNLRSIPLQVHRLRQLSESVVSIEIYLVVAVATLTIASPRFLPLATVAIIIFWLNRGALRLVNGELESAPAWAVGMPFALLLIFMLAVTSLVTAFPEITHPQVMRVVTGLGLYFALFRWLAWAPVGRACVRWRVIAVALCILLLVLALAGPFIVSWQGSKLPFIPASLYASFSLMVADSVNPNVLAGALILFIPVVLAWWLFPLGAGRWFVVLRLLAGAALIAGVAMLVLTQSRGAFMGLFLACAVLFMLRWPRLALPLLGLVGAGALFIALRPDTLAALTDAVGDTVTNGLPYRMEIWSRGWFMVQDFMFTGIGMGSFEQVTELLYPLIITPPGVPHAHNLLLQIAVDLGVPGLIAWLGILGTVVVACWRAYRSDDPMLRALGAGLLASQVALLGHGLTDAVTWGMVRSAPLVWLLWGVAVAAGLVARQREAQATSTHPVPRAA